LPRSTLFNARIETADSTPAFRDAWKSRRCLVPAEGYFEWTVSDDDGKKDPWLLQMPDGEGFSFAGLWAHNDYLSVTSCTIIRAPAVPEIACIPTRMPVMLPTENDSPWLDTDL
jgi:putative SOS response-associated peptidase YedK